MWLLPDDSLSIREPLRTLATSVSVKETMWVWLAVPWMSRSRVPSSPSWAAVMSATCPWFEEMSPSLSVKGGVLAVGLPRRSR